MPRTRLPQNKVRRYKVLFVRMDNEAAIEEVYRLAENLHAAINVTKLEATGKLMFDLHWDEDKE